jgi:hypothetical protein
MDWMGSVAFGESTAVACFNDRLQLELGTRWRHSLTRYFSKEYQQLKELRVNELTTSGSAVFVEGFDPSTLNQ